MPLPPEILNWASQPSKSGLSDPSTTVDIEPDITDEGLAYQAERLMQMGRALVKDDLHFEARMVLGWSGLHSVTRLFLRARQTAFSVADIELAQNLPRHVSMIDARLVWKRYHFIAEACDRARSVANDPASEDPAKLSPASATYQQEAAVTQEIVKRCGALLAQVDGIARA